MNSKNIFIVLILWISIGLAGFFILYSNYQFPSQEQLTKISQNTKFNSNTPSDTLNYFAKLFLSEPALLAVFLADSNLELKGSIFESKRISSSLHEKISKHFSQFVSGTSKLKRNLLRVNLSNATLTVYFLFNKKYSPMQAWHLLSRRIKNLHYAVGFFFLGAAILLIFLVLTMFNTSKHIHFPVLPRINRTHKDIETRQVAPIEDSERTGTLAKESGNRPELSRHQLQDLLFKIRELSGAMEITYLVYDNNQWEPWMQMRGELIIKGQSINYNKLPLQMIKRTDEWVSNLKSPDNTSWILPVRNHSRLTGSIIMNFAKGHYPKSPSISERIQSMINQFARSLSIQRTYEKAVYDSEVDAFTYPYFYFAIKEKVASRNIEFTGLIFQLGNLFAKDYGRLKEWSIQVNQLLGENHNHLFARLDRDRFAIIFDNSSRGLNLEQTIAIMNKIKDEVTRVIDPQITIFGALVPVPLNGNISHDDYLNRLQHALTTSIEEKTFGGVLTEMKVGVFS